MKVFALIPARMNSSRFPGKPLSKICGIPMVGHIAKRVLMAKLIDTVAVATCDEVIKSYVESFDGIAVMTSDSHERATERCAEAVLKLESKYGKADIVMMVQGDEPMVSPEVLDQAILMMKEDSSLKVLNVMTDASEQDFKSKDVVKVVVNQKEEALYFSRESIPTDRYGFVTRKLKQTGLIVFRRNCLLSFNELSSTYLEKTESVDMLRLLESGEKVKMLYTDKPCPSVDTPADRNNVEKLMLNEQIFKKYYEEMSKYV